MSHRPRLAADDVARIRRWHESSYAAAKVEAGDSERSFDYLGLTLAIPPTVQPITRMSHLLGTAVRDEVRAGELVLDMGTGSGVNALLAARSGARVVAVDVNPDAVAAAEANAARNGVGDRVDVRLGDVFAALDPAQPPFDLVVFDPPFRWFAPRDRLEAASTDEDYRTLRTFFAQIHDHLAPGGRLLLFFGSSGDLAYLRELMSDAGFVATVVNRGEHTGEGVTVEYFTYRLTLT